MTHETVSPSLPAAGIRHNTRWLTICGLMMAMNIGLSSFGLPVPGGHLYLNDIIIVTAALILDPAGAFLVGGVGAFLGDFFFYPLPMFVSLAAHGLQAMAISYISRHCFRNSRFLSVSSALLTGALIMVVGYSLGRAFLYSTPEYALLKLPYQILQAAVGAVAGVVLCYPCGLKERFHRAFFK